MLREPSTVVNLNFSDKSDAELLADFEAYGNEQKRCLDEAAHWRWMISEAERRAELCEADAALHYEAAQQAYVESRRRMEAA